MEDIEIVFSQDNLTKTYSLIKYARNHLQERLENSHSGVDQFMFSSWIQDAETILNLLESSSDLT